MLTIYKVCFTLQFMLNFKNVCCCNEFTHPHNFVSYFHVDLSRMGSHKGGEHSEPYVFSQNYNSPITRRKKLSKASHWTNYIFMPAYNINSRLMCTKPALRTLWMYLISSDTLVFLVSRKHASSPSMDNFCLKNFWSYQPSSSFYCGFD